MKNRCQGHEIVKCEWILDKFVVDPSIQGWIRRLRSHWHCFLCYFRKGV